MNEDTGEDICLNCDGLNRCSVKIEIDIGVRIPCAGRADKDGLCSAHRRERRRFEAARRVEYKRQRMIRQQMIDAGELDPEELPWWLP